jgi:hypothetical protein
MDASTPAGEEVSWACPTKPARRSKAAIEAIKDAIYDIVDEDPPMTVRRVFYQLVVRGVIEKTEKEYQGTVIRLLADMRLNGELPFSYIVDESRRRRITETHNNPTEAVDACAKFYRRSALREASDDYIEIWCEKEALAGLLWDVTSDYDVPLRAIVREVIERHITEEALTSLRAAEESERELLRSWASNLPDEAAP